MHDIHYDGSTLLRLPKDCEKSFRLIALFGIAP
jgi:hypothetical protein